LKQRVFNFEGAAQDESLPHGKEEQKRIANSYIAGGGGRAAIGYALVNKNNQLIVSQRLELRRNMVQGQINGHNKRRQMAKKDAEVESLGLSLSDTPKIANG
jgi:hypothetical protein